MEKFRVRTLFEGDFDAIVEIDSKVYDRNRPEYYQVKFAKALDPTHQLVVSLVAEYEDRVVGFIIGEAYLGEFGIPDTTASIDTIGVDPEFQHQGVARALIEEFATTVRKAGITRIHTLVNWNDHELLRFFDNMGFTPAKTLNLELDL
jgi:ribosomal protein S18 acetylase RimI-like enzyme